jgi:hypothetical protein
MNIYRSGTSRWRAFGWKIVWTVFAMFSPEFVLWRAAMQLRNARNLYRERNKCFSRTEDDKEKDATRESPVTSDHSNFCPVVLFRRKPKKELWGIEHGYFASMGGFELLCEGNSRTSLEQGKRTVITSAGVLRLAELDMLPDISEKTIHARSKSGGLAKGLVCLQVSWMLIQTIARKVSGLPITLLELNTLSHVGCCVIFYALWWYKPQDVTETVMIDVTECERCNMLLRNKIDDLVTVEAPNAGDKDLVDRGKAMPFFLGVLSLAYGGVHISAWNSHFPSDIEQIMWRVAACIVAGGGFVLGGCAAWSDWLVDRQIEEPLGMDIFFVISGLLYCAARLFLVTEAFISIRSLPVGAYDTVVWSTLLPHLV